MKAIITKAHIDSFLLFFFFWLTHDIWSSPARDQLQATFSIYAAPVVMQDSLTHCARLDNRD